MEQDTRPTVDTSVATAAAAATSTSSPSPPQSPLASRRATSRGSLTPSLTLDLSNLPPIDRPTQPSNTLLITNLLSNDIFQPDNLQTIRELLSKMATIHTWTPLKCFRRIQVSFYDVESAVMVRRVWDGEEIMGQPCRVYFGKPTPIEAPRAVHLALPDAGKLFFISPPPSPPHGWEMRLEDAPNKMVHADDLAEALAKLHHHEDNNPMAGVSPISPAESSFAGRSRSSTLIFQPQPELGNSPDLPCVTVDDLTSEPLVMSPLPMSEPKPIMAHTQRPPVELMHDA